MPVRKMNSDQAQATGFGEGSRVGLIVASTILLAGLQGLGFQSEAFAQTPVVSVGSTSGAAGTAVDLPVSFTSGATPVSTLQFDLTLPAGVSYVSVTTGVAAATAGKSASASGTSGGVRVVIFGLNQNGIGSGSIATVRLNTASGLAAGSKTVSIAGIVAADPGGNNVATNGSAGAVTIAGSVTRLPAPKNVRVK